MNSNADIREIPQSEETVFDGLLIHVNHMQVQLPDGRSAMTHWRVLEPMKSASLLECRLTTGRTHQIRVHMSSIGHPLLGDPVYGPKKMPYSVSGGQLLHAFRLGFVHPTTGEEMLFEAPPEERFLDWQRRLRL